MVAASSCSYFDGNGSDFRNQTVVIKRDRGIYCILNKTTPNGVAVPCAGNATATRVNDTHVLLKTNDLGDKLMEYGRDNEPGKFSEPIAADCPYSPELLNVGESPHDHPHQHYGIYGALVLVIIIILFLIAFFIYKKYEKRRKLQKYSNKDALKNGEHMNGTGQTGLQTVLVVPPPPQSADMSNDNAGVMIGQGDQHRGE